MLTVFTSHPCYPGALPTAAVKTAAVRDRERRTIRPRTTWRPLTLLTGSPVFPPCASHWRCLSTPTRRYHGRTLLRPPSACSTQRQKCLHTRKFGTLAGPPPPVWRLPWRPHPPGHANDAEILIDHESNQSSPEKTIFGLSSLLFQTDSISEVGILDDLVQR